MSAEVVHRLGAAVGIVTAFWGLTRWWETASRRRWARRRVTELLVSDRAATVRGAGLWKTVRRWLPDVLVVGAGWILVGGVAGLVLGLIGAAGLGRWRRRQQAAVGADAMNEVESRLAARQLPLAADLLAACIAAGAGPVIAAQAVGEALGGPVGEGLARGAAEVRLGGEPAIAWRRLASIPGAAGLARLLERADVSGLPAAGPVARLAADTRADWTRAATTRARRAAVMVTVPVGLCFLPAFIAVGVLPIVIGLAGGVLGGGGR
ncbi:Flp pilus assembly protein TadB [Streptomyces sp. 3330]|uniref:type II secretion system F family protein n=1 Tax=Streptomyces sp. 3330 TaxID=2817755 RepID=UPI002855308E|nr:type II secretion system F family protein [Streptomyces sp. 3330]MDR6976578.1 Flp pilus assembly protein TadB [Streptomyces sp. 3330]